MDLATYASFIDSIIPSLLCGCGNAAKSLYIQTYAHTHQLTIHQTTVTLKINSLIVLRLGIVI